METSLAHKIIGQLKKDPSGGAKEIQATEGNLRAEVSLEDWDRLGCLLRGFDLVNDLDGPWLADPIRIKDQVTYLGEQLEIIESEGAGGRTILRSTPPRMDGDAISFFEMVVDPAKGLSLARYRYDRQQGERKPVPVSLTCETLERLAADLSRLARQP